MVKQEKSILSRKQDKGSNMSMTLMWSRDKKKATVTRTKRIMCKMKGDEATELNLAGVKSHRALEAMLRTWTSKKSGYRKNHIEFSGTGVVKNIYYFFSYILYILSSPVKDDNINRFYE